MRTLLVFVTALFLSVAVYSSTLAPQSSAQKALTTVNKMPFEPKEQLYYEAEFSRAIFRKLDVADLEFSAGRTILTPNNEESNQSPEVFIFKADIASKGFFTRLFNLNFKERVESIVEPRTFTVQRTSIYDQQGKRVRTSESIFDSSKGKMSWTLRDPNNPSQEPRQIIADFSGQIHDVLSAIYFIRTQPLVVGKSLEIFIGDGGQVYKVPIRVVERKRMKTILGKVEVVRVDPELFGPDRLIDSEKGHFSLWLTADQRRIPVVAKVKTDYGTFDIKLKKITYGASK